MVDHLAQCAACRQAVADQDPSLLFGLLARVVIPESILDSVSETVAHHAGSDHPAVSDVWWNVTSVRRVASAAVVALALLTGLFALRGRAPAPVTAVVPAVSVPASAAVEVQPDAAVSEVVDLTVGETQVVMVYNGNLRL